MKKSIVFATIITMVIIFTIVIWKNFGLYFIVKIGDMKIPNKNEIFELVTKNQIDLTNSIEKDIFDSVEKIKGIESVNKEEGYTDFYCGSKGIGAETSYYGFYYSKDNAIDVKENIEYPKGAILKPDGKGYSWEESDGDNRFYVEQIIDGFFYYESHY